MESAPCIESIFIFPKILAGKQKADLFTSISRCNPIASVKDHNLSSAREWGQFLSGSVFQELSQAETSTRQWSHTKQSPRVTLFALRRNRETTALSHGDSDCALPHHPFAASAQNRPAERFERG